MVNALEGGVIYASPLPTIQSDQAMFPAFCRLSDAEIICVHTRGVATGSVDRTYAVARSTDGGKTWQDEGALWDKRQDERLYSYGYGYPQLLPDGDIQLAGYRWDRTNSDPDFNIYNPQTLGAVPLETILFRSGDGGRTWSAPQVVPPPPGVAMANPTSRILSLCDGRLMLPIETWKSWDDAAPVKQRSMALFSRDGGRTWREYVTVAADSTHKLIYWNGCFAKLKDDRIFAMYWVKDSTTENDLPIRATWSNDQGQSGTEPVETSLIGQMGCCIDVGGAKVMAVFNRRDKENAGIWAAVSHDGGRSWPDRGHTLLWDASGRDVLGGAHPNNRSRSIYDEGIIAFGKPDVIAASDGSFLVGFWCTSNFVIQLRWVRVNIDRAAERSAPAA